MGFKGRLYVEKGTGRVLCYLAREPLGSKQNSRLKDVAFIIDYDDVTTEGQRVFLPVDRVTFYCQNWVDMGIIVRLHKYQKIRSDITLTFSN